MASRRKKSALTTVLVAMTLALAAHLVALVVADALGWLDLLAGLRSRSSALPMPAVAENDKGKDDQPLEIQQLVDELQTPDEKTEEEKRREEEKKKEEESKTPHGQVVDVAKPLVEERPDKANYASTSAVFQLTSELFNEKTGAHFQYIPFKSGAELVTAVISGQAAMTFADAGPAMPLFKAGKLRPLATTGATRLPALPDVPTLGEVGIDGVVVEGFIGLAAPKGTPAPIVKQLETEIMAIARLPDVAGRITQLGLIPDGSSGAAFHDRIARDIAKYTAVARAAHIQFD